jgi:hypothetical protein
LSLEERSYSDLHTLSWFESFDTFAQGGDFATIYVRPTSSPLSRATTTEGEDGRFPDEVKWFMFSAMAWTKDSKDFLYQVHMTHLLTVQAIILIDENFCSAILLVICMSRDTVTEML